MSKLKAIDVVYANWCPHCVPTAVEPMKKAAAELGVPIKLLDIDTDAVKEADRLVEKYGDWSPDYLIPQVFLEFDDGQIKHVLTGVSQGVAYTRRAVDNLLKSDLFKKEVVH
jgi:thiol-disulfide isomerase/thioredoxin